MKSKLLLGCCLILLASVTRAQLWVPKVFGDNMVLQRNANIPVWGKANPNSKIVVELAGNSTQTLVNEKGEWSVSLPKLAAGGPFVMQIAELNNSSQSVKFSNVMIGDVWVASGQSNMEMKISESKDAVAEIKNAIYPNIRFLIVPHDVALHPKSDILPAQWKQCDSSTAADFSAVAYYFSRHIQQQENVAIGIIQPTWGGTPVEAWTSKEMLMTIPELAKVVVKNEIENKDESIFKKNEEVVKVYWDIIYNSYNGLKKKVNQISYNDSEWPTLKMPATVRSWGNGPYEGILWFRKTIDLSTLANGQNLSLSLGHPEMNYSLYFNGQEICKNVWNAARTHTYSIPAKLVKKGKNVVVLRMAALWGGGGLNEPTDSLYLTNGKEKVSLAGIWTYKQGIETDIPKTISYQYTPSYLYNAMINPIIPYGIKGFIWYQGEANTSAAYQYQTTFPLMINDWRIRWQQGYLPFLYVQLANYMKRAPEPVKSEWAELRDAQLKTLNLPNTAMATIIDIGEGDDIHPKNKQDVGLRLALAAENTVYGKKETVGSGPLYDSLSIIGNKVNIKFKQIGSGLMTKGGAELKGFIIAGTDQKFYWAKAIINGNTVEVSSDKVIAPVAIRYAWADNPDCNLYNNEGLPASPFRTDNWSDK
ncbi:sialate O-acetylesterase [Solitalea sp. MAHUQ-68]|uniref:Sialate O-acetylesterase n=1 Tax=Solitalea agri TaxID=2953739 RepID=A0A9X2EYW8_9SPHI|nr:sialate O-acetylesterase [Solitalea agri]MCO4291569.1 sialate O-acetylesterase [Solitalea agri]